MAVTVKQAEGGSFKQMTITSGETGQFFLPVSLGKNVKIGINDGHGATYDVITQLAPFGQRDSRDQAITPNTYTEVSGQTGEYNAKFALAMGQVGINITAAPTSDLVLEVSEGAY